MIVTVKYRTIGQHSFPVIVTVKYRTIGQSLYNTPHYNTDLDITRSFYGYQISLPKVQIFNPFNSFVGLYNKKANMK